LRVARDAEAVAVAAQKASYSERIRLIQAAVDPPLRNTELALALGLPVPPEGQPGASPVGRWLSTSPRLRRSRPDTGMRALIDLILEGELFLAVQAAAAPGARRTVVLCVEGDLPRIGADFEVLNLGGREVPARDGWDDEDDWDLFGQQAPEPEAPAPAPATPAPPPPATELPWLPLPRMGLGCMRLSTTGRPPRADSIDVLRSAWDLGVRLFDTADVYALDQDDLHHNHRLLAEALAGRDALFATKGGLARPGGRWMPSGRPEDLLASARTSHEILGRVALWQLHAPDKRVPWDEQLDAVHQIHAQGLADAVGLCNVKRDQVQAALDRGVPIACVQLGVSVLEPRDLRQGLVTFCLDRGIQVLAHSPLGGHAKRGKLAVRLPQATRSAEQRALAWLLEQGVVPLVGATRVASLADSWAALDAPLSDAERSGLATTFKRWWSERPPPRREIRVVMGPQASGKTRSVQPLVGWTRFNRDEAGGTLAKLAASLDAAVAQGTPRSVLDNTYPNRDSRAAVLATGQRHTVPVTCVRVDLSEDQCRINACRRMIERHGRVLSPAEIRASKDPNMLPPAAISAWFRRYQPPTSAEGFAWVRTAPGNRWRGTERALLFDLDGTLRRSTGGAPYPCSPDEVELLPGRAQALQDLHAQGWLLLGVTNQAGVERGDLTLEAARAAADRTVALSGVPMDVRLAPFSDRQAWTRKPLPGMGVELMVAHDLDPARCMVIGDMKSDRDFAVGLGMRFAWADDFFEDVPAALKEL
jgi:HAD superfamily hydrolase (TIGR01662 family)